MAAGKPSHAAANVISQLLAETLHLSAPITAEIHEVIKHKVKDQWLDDLEEHTTKIAGPVIDILLEKGNMPPAIRSLLEQAKVPTAALGSFVQQFLIYGVMFSLASTGLQPLTQELSNTLWTEFSDRPLSPPDIASAVVRGIALGDSAGVDVPDWAVSEAANSGIDPDRFLTLVGTTGEAPALQLLFEMIRRGIITEDQLTDGIKEGDVKDKWIPFVEKLRYVQPTPTDFVAAAVREQMDYNTALSWATQVGLEPAGYLDDNPDWFKLLFDISGRPPGPEEAGRMANRNIIPWTGTGPDALSFQQSIAESDIKTKWTDVLRQLQVYVPPPRMVGGLLKTGSITTDQAKQFWMDGGVPSALADAYVHQATTEETEQEKALAKGDVLKGVFEGIISQTDATSLLSVLGYTGKTATYMIELTLMRREFAAISKAINAVGSLYVHYKMTAVDAKSTLEGLEVPGDQITDLLNIWTIQRKPEVRLPSISEIGKAVKYGGLDFNAAVSSAELLGYTPYDATLVIAAASETPPPNGFPPQTDTGVNV